MLDLACPRCTSKNLSFVSENTYRCHECGYTGELFPEKKEKR